MVGALVVVWQGHWVSQNKELFRGEIKPPTRPDGTIWVDCNVCDKSGEIPRMGSTTSMRTCPVCFGVSGHYVLKHDELDKNCPVCSSMGRVFLEGDNSATTCYLCDGRGIARVPPGHLLCPECKGRKEQVGADGETKRCWLCRGDGMILSEMPMVQGR